MTEGIAEKETGPKDTVEKFGELYAFSPDFIAVHRDEPTKIEFWNLQSDDEHDFALLDADLNVLMYEKLPTAEEDLVDLHLSSRRPVRLQMPGASARDERADPGAAASRSLTELAPHDRDAVEKGAAPVAPDDRRTRLRELARLFLRLGTIAFGGPAAHIAMMEDEVVRRRRWVSHEEFLDMIGACNLIPGPNSTEMAIHIGHRRAGFAGLAVAGACFAVPAVAITIVIAWAYVRFGSMPQVAGALYGIKPVIIAVVVQALWRLWPSARAHAVADRHYARGDCRRAARLQRDRNPLRHWPSHHRALPRANREWPRGGVAAGAISASPAMPSTTSAVAGAATIAGAAVAPFSLAQNVPDLPQNRRGAVR